MAAPTPHTPQAMKATTDDKESEPKLSFFSSTAVLARRAEIHTNPAMHPTTTTATATTATTTTTTNSSAGSPLAERVAGRGLEGVLDCRDGRSKLPDCHCMSRASTAVPARRAVIPQPDDNDHDDLPPADNPLSFFVRHL